MTASDASGGIWLSPSAGRAELITSGKAVVDSSEALHQAITEKAGADAANLFARPERRGDGSIVWHDRLGATSTVSLAELAPEKRVTAEAELRRMLADVERLYDVPAHAAVAGLMLNVESADAIRVAGTRPILAGWGNLPSRVTTTEQLASHHAASLGPHLSRTEPPEIDPKAASTAGAAGLAASAVAAPAVWQRLRNPAIASAIAAAALLFLLLPGVLNRTPQVIVSVPSPAPQIPAPQRDDVADGLEAQIRQRESLLNLDVCVLDNNQQPRLLPGRASEQGGPRSVPGTPPGTEPNTGPRSGRPQPDAAVPPSRALPSLPVPDGATPPDMQRPDNLQQLLTNATVLVLTRKGSGTGFFVGPQHVLTNRHVVADSGGVIMVGNKQLEQMRHADRVAMTAGDDPGTPDYALLKLRDARSSTYLSLSQESPQQLQNVVAAGFPSIVLSTDANFERLISGVRTAMPEMALSKGAVVVVQAQESQTPVVLHHASLSQGNSGGPLVDECGRVVGVNTFVRRSQGADDRMNYSLATRSTLDFLRANGVTPNVVAGVCTTGSSATAPPTAPADGAQPGATATQPGTAPPTKSAPSGAEQKGPPDRN